MLSVDHQFPYQKSRPGVARNRIVARKSRTLGVVELNPADSPHTQQHYCRSSDLLLVLAAGEGRRQPLRGLHTEAKIALIEEPHKSDVLGPNFAWESHGGSRLAFLRSATSEEESERTFA